MIAPPVNNPAGGARSTAYVGIGFYGWETGYVQSGMGKGTFIFDATHTPEDMGGVPYSEGEIYTSYDDPPGEWRVHYGDYIAGPIYYFYDVDGYWAATPNYLSIIGVVDWGDGSPLEVVNNITYAGGLTAPTHVYEANGTYTVSYIAYTSIGPGMLPTNYDFDSPEYPETPNSVRVYVDDAGTITAYANQLSSDLATVLDVVQSGGFDFYLDYQSGDISGGHSIFKGTYYGSISGTTINAVHLRKSDHTYIGDASYAPTTFQLQPWYDIQTIATFEVVANDGPAYHGYTGPKNRLGLTVEELMELGSDDTFSPMAAIMAVPWAEVQTGTDSDDITDEYLSPPIGLGEPDSYWPGEGWQPVSAGDFDVVSNNDLAGEYSDPPTLPPLNNAGKVRINPPDGTRSPWMTGDSDEYETILLGLDGSGRMLYPGRGPSGDPMDMFTYYWLGAVDEDGLDTGLRIRPDDRFRLFYDFYFYGGEWHGPHEFNPRRPKWRGIYSDDEVLLEIGDGNIFVVNINILDDGKATSWYFLTNLKHFNIGYEPPFVSDNVGRGYNAKLRAGGGFWLKTITYGVQGTTTVVGIDKDGANDQMWMGPTGRLSTFNSGDFPNNYGANWNIYEIVGDPQDHDVVYISGSYLEPYPEYRSATLTGYNPPRAPEPNDWVSLIRRVSAVFRCDKGAEPVPALWLQEANWFSTDGKPGGWEHVRQPSIFISGLFWTNSEYTGGHWAGKTKKYGIPPLRQRHRDDGLTTDIKQERGSGSSQQSSLRRGGRVYY